jgi:ketol-acid reductoisomerase
MTAFQVARDAGVPGEALVLEMYMSGEMEMVFESFRKTGFFRASEAHGSTAVFGGITRTLELDHAAMAETFRTVLHDIQSGGFARRFQDEERDGYPMLGLARELMHRPNAMTDAEDHVRDGTRDIP